MEQARPASVSRWSRRPETLIGLLAVTGMRISEAIKLDRADVDWTRACCSSASPSSTSRATCRSTQHDGRARTYAACGTGCAQTRRAELLHLAATQPAL